MNSEKAWEILIENNCELLTTLCEIPQPLSPPLVDAVIALLDQKGASERFVKHLLVRKIKASSLTESKDVTNVFRENNSAALLAATFSLSHGGSEFVKNLITEPFQAVAGLLKAVEVNPESLPEGEDIAPRIANLVEAVNKIMEVFYSAANKLPASIRSVSTLLYQESVARLTALGLDSTQSKEGSLRLVGGYIFLRILIPPITNASSFSMKEFSKEERRGSILLAKIITHLGSQSEIGAKEDYLKEVNEKLQHHRAQVTSFLEKVSVQDESESDSTRSKTSVEASTSLSSMKPQLELVVKHIEKTIQKLQAATENDESLKTKFTELNALFEKPAAPVAPTTTPTPSTSTSTGTAAPTSTQATSTSQPAASARLKTPKELEEKATSLSVWTVSLVICVVAVVFYFLSGRPEVHVSQEVQK